MSCSKRSVAARHGWFDRREQASEFLIYDDHPILERQRLRRKPGVGLGEPAKPPRIRTHTVSTRCRSDAQATEYDWLGTDSRGRVALFSTPGAGYAPDDLLRDLVEFQSSPVQSVHNRHHLRATSAGRAGPSAVDLPSLGLLCSPAGADLRSREPARPDDDDREA